jgi:glutamate-1-semialdehyde 2,1-aminomutase
MFQIHHDSMTLATTTMAFYGVGAAAVATSLATIKRRLELSQAKHPSLVGHSRIARRLAAFIPFYEYDEAQFFCSDGAPADVAQRRRAGFERLAALYKTRFAESVRQSAEASQYISDLQFTGAYRVPFQYRRKVRADLPIGALAQSTDGVMVTDLDGNRFYDLGGSYGVNVLGYDFYKDAIERGAARVRELGPLLGTYHPIIIDNVKRIRKISGLDEVSFHMSGTEAVMQAVRLARYHTRRTHLVRFCGAYHGWWGDVQPGIGNPLPAHETYTLREMSEESLHVLRTRRDIACVLVNPEQSFHPNGPAPTDSALIDSGRSSHFDKAAYTDWLKRLRQVCTEQNIVLIIDEIFVGFRIAAGGAQEYFGVQADLVTYGKTIGGGLPIGVVCGHKDLMKRFRDDRPADICFARGTFNSHPYVMAAMNEFLREFQAPQAQALYHDLDETWNARAKRLNQRLRDEELPVQIVNMSSLFVVCYTQPSRYNWMLQYYLRAEGLALSWVGTARLIFSLTYTDAEFDAVVERFVAAAKAMQQDGWWWRDPKATNKSIKRAILKEMIARRLFSQNS